MSTLTFVEERQIILKKLSRVQDLRAMAEDMVCEVNSLLMNNPELLEEFKSTQYSGPLIEVDEDHAYLTQRGVSEVLVDCIRKLDHHEKEVSRERKKQRPRLRLVAKRRG